MKKVVPALVVLVVWLSCALGSALYAQDKPDAIAVNIDKDRNALISTSSVGNGDGAKTSVHLGTDFASGLSALDLTAGVPPSQQANAHRNVDVYAESNDNESIAVGNGSIALPPDLKGKLSADAQVVQTSDNMGINAKFDVSMANPQPNKVPFNKFAVDGSSKTDYKSWTATLHVNASVPDLQKKVQLNTVQLTWLDTTDKDNKISSTAQLTISADPNSQFAQQIKNLAANKTQTEEMLKSRLGMVAGLTVESLKIDKAEVNDKTAELAISLKATGIRDAISRYSDIVPFAQYGFDDAQMKSAINNILALTFDKFDLSVKLDKDTVAGSLDLSAKNATKAMTGYLNLMSSIQQSKSKDLLVKAQDPSAKMAVQWYLAIQKRLEQLNQDAFDAMSTNGASLEQSLSMSIEAKPDIISLTGNLQQKMSNIGKALAQLKTKGWPVFDRAGFTMNLKSDGPNATGMFYATARGNVFEAAKSFIVTPAQQDPDLKSTADLLNSVKLQDARLVGNFKDGNFTMKGYVQNSDLSTVASVALKALAPNMPADPTGARLTVESDGSKTTTTASLGFKQFMPGKSNEDVQNAIEQLTKSNNVVVKADADAATVALAPKLDKPAIEMPAALTSVRQTAEAQLFPVSAIGGGGAPSLGLIIGVAVAVLALLGIAMAASRKK
jgi:hypothetical protein